MQLSDYLKSLTPQARETFAKKAKTTVAYLYQIAGGHRACGPKLTGRIESASGGQVTRQDLRADLFGKAASQTSAGEVARA